MGVTEENPINFVVIAMMLNLVFSMATTIYTQGDVTTILDSLEAENSNTISSINSFKDSDNVIIASAGNVLSYIEGIVNVFVFISFLLKLFIGNLVVTPIVLSVYGNTIAERVGFIFVSIFVLIINGTLIKIAYDKIVK